MAATPRVNCARGSADTIDAICPPDPSPPNQTRAKYRLEGPQVEPTAGYWTQGDPELVRVVPVAHVLDLIRDRDLVGLRRLQSLLQRVPDHRLHLSQLGQVGLAVLARHAGQLGDNGASVFSFEKQRHDARCLGRERFRALRCGIVILFRWRFFD